MESIRRCGRTGSGSGCSRRWSASFSHRPPARGAAGIPHRRCHPAPPSAAVPWDLRSSVAGTVVLCVAVTAVLRVTGTAVPCVAATAVICGQNDSVAPGYRLPGSRRPGREGRRSCAPACSAGAARLGVVDLASLFSRRMRGKLYKTHWICKYNAFRLTQISFCSVHCV
jgi:hypothetical protein